ncbi:MAG: hypothetical protein CAK90_08595 [Spartobacteria bacterium AMD-G4]|nr:MAG: hypothetical protein CAK90_08595 [Spartobacteria bacterium AMD-G4]
MKTATVRDLRYDFPKLEAWLAGGEEILITKHSKAVAKISRATEPVPAASASGATVFSLRQRSMR